MFREAEGKNHFGLLFEENTIPHPHFLYLSTLFMTMFSGHYNLSFCPMEKLTIYNNMNKMFPASKESFTKHSDFIEGKQQ